MLKKMFDNFNTLAYQYGQLESIEKWASIDAQGMEIPWYTYPAIEYLNSLDFSKKIVFEYGSGNSSIYWAKKSKRVVSIENDQEWFSKVNDKKLSNQEIILVEESSLYENSIEVLNQNFDLIIIDGKRRVKCSEMIYEYLNITSEEGCMVILDNSDWYKDIAKYLKEKFNFIQIDFHGFGPINNYTWTTSIFLSRNFNFKSTKQIQPLSSVGAIQNNAQELEIIKYFLKSNNISNENIVIYGFGVLGKNLYLGLNNDYCITKIVDNKLFNQKIDAISIQNKHDYLYEDEYVMITVLNKVEIDKIVLELKSKYNVEENKIIICAYIIENYFKQMNDRFKKISIYELKTFAQDSEDTILKRIFEYRNLSEGGTYVDVGAHHPIKYSNTHFFYEKGWRGINIDAMPGSMKVFDRVRPKDINLEYAISNKEETLTYYQFEEAAYNSFDKMLSLSRAKAKNISVIDTKEIKTTTLSSVFEQFMLMNQSIDFLSIDVEGLDFQVLQSNDWDRYRPKVVLIEVLDIDIEQMTKTKVYEFMLQRHYRYFAKTVGTHFFIENTFFHKRFGMTSIAKN